MLGDFSILTIPLLCTLKSLWVNHGVVPKNKWFHITGTLADSHTDHEQRFSPVATYLRVPDDGGSSWAGDKPKIPEAPEAKRKAPRRSAPSAKGRGDRKRPSAPAPEDQARPGAELAARSDSFVMFFTRKPEGVLAILMKEALGTNWRTTQQVRSCPPSVPMCYQVSRVPAEHCWTWGRGSWEVFFLCIPLTKW